MKKEDLRKIVYKGDTRSLLQDGLTKAVNGITSIEEVLRLVELEDEDTQIVINSQKEMQQNQMQTTNNQEQTPTESDEMLEL